MSQTICLKFSIPQQWIENSEEFKDRQTLPVLPLPVVEQRATSVLCVGPTPLSSPGRQAATSLSLSDPPATEDNKIWNRLEEMLLQVAQGSVPMIFKPTVDLYNDTTDCNPVVPQGGKLNPFHPNIFVIITLS